MATVTNLRSSLAKNTDQWHCRSPKERNRRYLWVRIPSSTTFVPQSLCV